MAAAVGQLLGIGLQLSPIKAQLGPLLNGIIVNENYVPEPTMKFEGVDNVLKQYQRRAAGQGVDPLGFWSPFAYAQLQILEATRFLRKYVPGFEQCYVVSTPFQVGVRETRCSTTSSSGQLRTTTPA